MHRILTQLEALLFFTLPFLAMSDQVLSFRVSGYNVRFAQPVLLLLIIIRMFSVLKSDQGGLWKLKNNVAFKSLLLLVVSQILILGTRVYPQLTALKLGWIVFNIGGAFILSELSTTQQKEALIKGIIASVFVNSIIILVDWASIAFGKGDSILGFAQLGNDWSRPHAFYYEPSYASSALALTAPFFVRRRFAWLSTGLLLFVNCLVGARTGLFFLGVYLSAVLLFIGRDRIMILKAVSTCLILLGLLSLNPRSAPYFHFVFGVLGPVEAAKRAGEKTSSEGGRIQQVLEELKIWRQSPIGGSGITHRGGERHGLDPLATNCWAEVLSEWGLVGFSSLMLILIYLFRGANLLESKIAILVHGLVNLNFTQTLPRLDFWIILFALMYLEKPVAVGATR